jgi:hypothetical protein
MATMVQAVGMGLHGRAMAASGTAAARESVAKNVLLFFAAPFIGLAYIVAFPFVGAVAMVRMALR